MSLHKLNPVEPPWYGPVCPVVGEGWHREVSPYPDQLFPQAKGFTLVLAVSNGVRRELSA
jgi:hypothetical protein